jgi:hypothetical protein
MPAYFQGLQAHIRVLVVSDQLLSPYTPLGDAPPEAHCDPLLYVLIDRVELAEELNA